MNNTERKPGVIDLLANELKKDCVGSNDYLSGINDGVYKALHHCLDNKITLPVADVREKAKEFLIKISKEPSIMSPENMLVKFYCDINGIVKSLHLQKGTPITPSPQVTERLTDHDLQNIICDWYDGLLNPQHFGIRAAFANGFRTAERRYIPFITPSPQVTEDEIRTEAKSMQAIHGGYESDFIRGAKWMRAKLTQPK